ncbi:MULTISPECIES: DUF6883 domain-containing protein [Methylobacterium]|uniref:DUF6883 domain-containing protein n=2 Tax=Methylobacterium TaxID=407 RepID=A0A0C6FU77_9HYPH|nr:MULTISPECIES: DUF6883 domain-containing protein [Methylobacterium]BAQ46630.1 hypothetical protein Maq22A_c17580 [Methylobacterium aquaticum]
MRPGFDGRPDLVIPFPKLTHYLLHDQGAAPSKAKFFIGHGFDRRVPIVLAQALWRQASPENYQSVRIVPFGRNLVFEGPILTPHGTAPIILSVWHAPHDDPRHVARFVTAYPS